MKIFENFINEMAVDPLADKIRQELKSKGYRPGTQISVRKGRGGMETAYYIDIKDLKVTQSEIEKIVKKFQSVSYDERSGEILAGGNTYIFVQYDYQVRSNEERRLKPMVPKIVDQALENKGKPIKLKNGYSLGIFPHVKDKEIEMMKTGNYELFRNNDMFFVYKNNRKLPDNETPGQIWWVLAMAGY